MGMFVIGCSARLTLVAVPDIVVTDRLPAMVMDANNDHIVLYIAPERRGCGANTAAGRQNRL